MRIYYLLYTLYTAVSIGHILFFRRHVIDYFMSSFLPTTSKQALFAQPRTRVFFVFSLLLLCLTHIYFITICDFYIYVN
jgi:hypothetical protein